MGPNIVGVVGGGLWLSYLERVVVLFGGGDLIVVSLSGGVVGEIGCIDTSSTKIIITIAAE